jgi:hypothetical protein
MSDPFLRERARGGLTSCCCFDLTAVSDTLGDGRAFYL